MITKTEYVAGRCKLIVELERIEVLIKSEDEVLNFPRLIRLADERLVLAYGRGQHGGKENERRLAAHSEDSGRSWHDFPPDSPWSDNLQTSGVLGYLRDGSIGYIDVFPVNQPDYYELPVPWYKFTLDDPVWRYRRFAADGKLIDDAKFRVKNLPWKAAAYYCYGDLLDFGNGELFTTLGAQVPEDIPTKDNIIQITTLFVRSTDNGKSFEYVSHIPPSRDGTPFGPEGINEPTLAILPDGELLCVMRTGGRAPLYQARSRDRGQTWSVPESTGWPAAKPDLRLLSNGVLACSSGRGVYGHPQVTHVMFSLDGRGEHWEAPFIFHTGPGCSYTSNMEKDGRLYVAYSDSSFGGELNAYNRPFQAIKWAVLNVTKTDVGHKGRVSPSGKSKKSAR